MRIDAVKTGLFFGTDTGNTEEIAEKICDALAQFNCAADMLNIAECDVSELQTYPFLILGIPTWGFRWDSQ